MNSPQFGFGSSGGGWPSTPAAATTANFGNLAATGNKPVTTTPFTSFGNFGAPATSSLSFGATTTLGTTTAKPGNFLLTYYFSMIRKKMFNQNYNYLGFSLGNNATPNAPLNLSFGANTTAATVSPFTLGTALNSKTAATTTGTQLTLGATTNVTTSVAPGKFKSNFTIININTVCSARIYNS